MYEMRAESTSDRGELIWHVIAKDATADTLCGSLLAPLQSAIEAAAVPVTERYCAPCMTAFSTAMQGSTPKEAA